MSATEVIPEQQQAVVVHERGTAVGAALSPSEIKARLSFIKRVMAENMTEGTDYGKIPGCGDKPGLFQPGAQKLSLTFQLAPTVYREVLRELRAEHREYEFTLAITAATGRVLAHGVGTCTTLEARYRFRSSARKCPHCGKETIFKSKNPGEGWYCWAKKGGCGDRFADNDIQILGQETGKIEHDNPADFYNTVRKMAFKRALVHGIINATNTSELWTQDLEDLAANGVVGANEGAETHASDKARQEKAAGTIQSTSPPKQNASKPNVAPNSGAKSAGATEITRKWFISQIDPLVREAWLQYGIEVGAIMPNEGLEDWSLTKVPTSIGGFGALESAVKLFAQTGQLSSKPIEVPRETQQQELSEDLREPFFGVIVPVPHAGQKRDDYLKHPDTIGSLFAARHEDETARKRLFGFVEHFEPKGWIKRDGTLMPPNASDVKFREALDAFADWYEKNHPREKL